jgi:hypothetical protein
MKYGSAAISALSFSNRSHVFLMTELFHLSTDVLLILTFPLRKNGRELVHDDYLT